VNSPERICVFYSPGQNFPNVLKNLRKRHPAAHIEALVPPNYPEKDLLLPAANEIVTTDYERYPLSKPTRLPRLVRQIQSRRYDRFVVLFDSMKQRWLCAVSGAPRAECWSVYGRVVPLENTLPGFLGSAVRRGLGGKWKYVYVWLYVHLIPARPSKPD
jgi:hypothetical protein